MLSKALGSPGGAIRLRVGLALFVLSWLPFAQLVIWVSDMPEPQAGQFRIAVWTVQFLVGLVGIALAGAESIKMARGLGWRRTPAALWAMFRTGRSAG